MERICIAGNSGAARECYWLLQDVLAADPTLAGKWQFEGFFSWKGYAGELKSLEKYFRGPLEGQCEPHGRLYVIGVGKPQLRRDIFHFLKERGCTLMNLIHPWTSICPTAVMGEGNILQRGCTIYDHSVLGNGNYLNGAVNLAHDSAVGDFNFIAPYGMVMGNARMGSCNHLGPYGVILDRCRIGDNNLIAPGSIVYKGCRDNCRMAGNPALKVGENSASTPVPDAAR